MRLIDVYSEPEADEVLWKLLSERTPEQSISHKSMPSYRDHLAFMRSRPYPHWYLIDVGEWAGACYLTTNHEIGIGILVHHRGHGYGKAATQMLMARHPGRFLANVNPLNAVSARMFTDLGFRHIQNTYEA